MSRLYATPSANPDKRLPKMDWIWKGTYYSKANGTKVQTGLAHQVARGLTSSPQGSPVNLTALQAAIAVLLTNVTSGQQSGGFWAKLDPAGSWEKTSQGCFPQITEVSSVEYSLTWPRWGMMSDGVVTELTMLEHGINETESSLLPTPNSFDALNDPPQGKEETGKNKHALKLAHAVRLPTALSRDWKGVSQRGRHKPMDCLPSAVLFPTPRSNKVQIAHAEKLGQAVRRKFMPTPKASDTQDRKKSARWEGHDLPSYLHGQEGNGLSRSRLSPTFVEWLMGFPAGWIDLER